MANSGNDEYFKLLHSFRAASHQGRGSTFISKHPEILSVRSEAVQETILQQVVSAGADLHAVDDLGETPLGLLQSQHTREQREGPPEQISVEGLIKMGFGEETIKNFRELQTKVDFSSLDRTRPDYVRARELLIEAGADPDNLGSGYD